MIIKRLKKAKNTTKNGFFTHNYPIIVQKMTYFPTQKKKLLTIKTSIKYRIHTKDDCSGGGGFN